MYTIITVGNGAVEISYRFPGNKSIEFKGGDGRSVVERGPRGTGQDIGQHVPESGSLF